MQQLLSVAPPGSSLIYSHRRQQHHNDVPLRQPKTPNFNLQLPVEKELNSEFKFLAPAAMALVLTLSPISNPPVSLAQTIDVQKGANLFQRACIGCHDTGGNIIQPGATLFMKDLLRNGVDTEEEIYKVTYYGKGRMPGFGVNCTPRGQCTFGPRLSEDEIKVLAEFVKSQADHDWPAIVTTETE